MLQYPIDDISKNYALCAKQALQEVVGHAQNAIVCIDEYLEGYEDHKKAKENGHITQETALIAFQSNMRGLDVMKQLAASNIEACKLHGLSLTIGKNR